MNVLSLFDGISAANFVLKQLNISCNYFSSEIDKYAEAVSNYHFNQIRLGDVTEINFKKLPKIDLLIGGPPCQDLSIAKANRTGLGGEQSSNFLYYSNALDICKPKYFIMENVASMRSIDIETISTLLGVQPILIDSSIVTAQLRKRLYWCNFTVKQPKDLNIKLKDIIQSGTTDREKSYCLDASYYKGPCSKPYFLSGRRQQILEKSEYRMLTPIECERLQGFSDNYTKIGKFSTEEKNISNTQRYKMLGNSFTVPVIKHLISHII